MAVRATSDFTPMSQAARCALARLRPSAALARASAASDGDTKPALLLNSVRREL